MNFKEAKKWMESGRLTQADVMRSPADKQNWFLTLRDEKNKAYMLVDDRENVQTYTSLDDAVMVIKNIGFKIVHIHI